MGIAPPFEDQAKYPWQPPGEREPTIEEQVRLAQAKRRLRKAKGNESTTSQEE